MRITLTTLLVLFVFSFSFAQVPGVKWQKTFGGSNVDEIGGFDTAKVTHPKVMIPINSGGYLIAGVTYSTNGDITGNHGGTDIWVARLDSSRNFIWKYCYGGSSSESLGSIKQIGDNGFILIGTTSSNNGDVSGNHGGSDIWVLRLDISGTIVWQTCLGGTANDQGNYIEPTSDGGFILTGATLSNNGNISAPHGGSDIWVAKLTSSGTLSWQKCLGGTKNDYGYVVKQRNNNYLIAGETFSNDGNVSGFHGTTLYSDIWVAQLNNVGSILWQKPLGGALDEGLGDMEFTSDGGLIVAGNTLSSDGDVSGHHAISDGWVVKLNSLGTIQWQKCIGGSNGDALADIQTLADGGYVAIGNTNSTDGDVSGLHGTYSHDAWVVRLSDIGNVKWTKCIGGTNIDIGAAIYPLSESDYITLSTTYSNDGDVTGNLGGSDFWLAKLSSVNTIKGTLFLDLNSNGIKDVNEPFYSEAIVKSKKTLDSASSIPYNGLFINSIDTGSYNTSVQLNRPYYNVVPSSYTSVFATYFNTDSLSFALQPIAGFKDLQVSIIPMLPARPGFVLTYTILYRNLGTETLNGEVSLKPDSRLSVNSSYPAYSTINSDTLKWAFSNLQPSSSASIQVIFEVPLPGTVNIGDTITSVALINPISADITPLDDTSIIKQRVVGSYDPNNKIENNGGIIGSDYVSQGKYLNYTIRFQNTGTDTAFSVIVRDTLDSKLDWSTFEMVTASHPYTVSITNQNKIEWTFSNINLPDSNINEPASHGYLSYRVKPKSTVAVGDMINNLASIYFDYNLPVATNNALTLVQDNFSPLPIQLINFTGQLNNNIAQLKWKVSDAKSFERFEIERSTDGRIYNNIGNVVFNNSISGYTAQDNISTLQSNHIFYRLKLVDADGKFTYSKVVAFNINATQNKFIVYPNPAKTEIYVSIATSKKENLHFKVIDASGRIISDQQKEIQKGNNVFPVDTSKLKAGNYMLQIVTNGEMKTLRVVIMN